MENLKMFGKYFISYLNKPFISNLQNILMSFKMLYFKITIKLKIAILRSPDCRNSLLQIYG